MSTDHIEARGRAMYCARCECAQTVNMPAKIDNIIKQMDDFREQHKDCRPNSIEAEMSEYIKGFDAGCEHMMREIQLYQHTHDTIGILDLIKHLRKGLK